MVCQETHIVRSVWSALRIPLTLLVAVVASFTTFCTSERQPSALFPCVAAVCIICGGGRLLRRRRRRLCSCRGWRRGATRDACGTRGPCAFCRPLFCVTGAMRFATLCCRRRGWCWFCRQAGARITADAFRPSTLFRPLACVTGAIWFAIGFRRRRYWRWF